MLTAHPAGPPEQAFWLDLLDPTPEEIAAVEAAAGVKVPSRAALSEIENSSRLRSLGQALYLSAPIIARGETAEPELRPIGFVLSAKVLITIRFAPFRAFDEAAAEMACSETPTSIAVFATLLEAVVDWAADLLEGAGGELDSLSRGVFSDASGTGQPVARANARLRQILLQVGRMGDRLGKIRAVLLGVGRIVPYAAEVGKDWIGHDIQIRLNAVRADVLSLADYETHLDGKNQFLLDAVLGFIATEQNDLFKVLTIVSVVGVPPTLLASIYGMNFVNMPELHWKLGYPYGLMMIVLSTVLPVLWFKWKRWW